MSSQRTLSLSLEEFGLSQYESKAYVTLIARGMISAGGLAYHAEIPRTKIYPILQKLEKKNLVTISKSKPIMCTGIAPENAFDDIIQEQVNKVKAMNSLVSDLKKINDDSKKSRGTEEKRYFHLSSNNVIEHLKTMIDGVKSSSTIHVMTDAYGLELLSKCKEQLVKSLRRDIKLKIIIPSNQVGSEAFKKIPSNIEIRFSEINQNCFIFDETELFLIDGNNGKGAIFSSTDILGSNQIKMFTHVWQNAIKTDCLADMTEGEAQEICKIIKIVDEGALDHLLNSKITSSSKHDDKQYSMLDLLEKNGINLKDKSFDEVIEIIDSTIQITCLGHVTFDAKNENISIESEKNSGHSLPWVSILNNYLHSQGFKTRIIYQNQLQKGEKVHIKISKEQRDKLLKN